MSIEGTYNIELKTPMGNQKGQLTLTMEGNSLSGAVTTFMGTDKFTDGKIDGDKLQWVVNANSPMGAMKLDFNATVSNDKISGEAKLGPMGSATFEGTRT